VAVADAVKAVLFQDAKALRKNGLDGFPLVVRRLSQEDEKSGRAFFDVWQHLNWKENAT